MVPELNQTTIELNSDKTQTVHDYFLPIHKDVLARIFFFLNLHSSTVLCLVSRRFKEYMMNEGLEIFKISSKWLGVEINDGTKEKFENEVEKFKKYQEKMNRTRYGIKFHGKIASPIESSQYHSELNFRIPQLRYKAKQVDAVFETKGLCYDPIFQKSADSLIEGIFAHMMLNRIGLSSWEMITKRLKNIRKCAGNSEKPFLKDLCLGMLTELRFFNEAEKSVIFFEEELLSFKNDESVFPKAIKQTLNTLLQKLEFEKAEMLLEKHWEREDKDVFRLLIIKFAVREKRFDIVQEQTLKIFKTTLRLYSLVCLINKIFESENNNEKMIKKLIEKHQSNILKDLISIVCKDLPPANPHLIKITPTLDECDGCVQDVFERFQELPLFKKYLNIESNLEKFNMTNDESNRGIARLLRANTKGNLADVIINTLIKKCIQLDESVLHQALCSEVSDQLVCELIEKVNEIKEIKTFINWKRSDEIENLLLQKTRQLVWDPSIVASNVFDARIVKLLKKCKNVCVVSSDFETLTRRNKQTIFSIFNACSNIDYMTLLNGISCVFSRNGNLMRFHDDIIIKMIEKFQNTELAEFKESDPFSNYNSSSTRYIDESQQFDYLEIAIKDRDQKVKEALKQKFSSSGCLLM